MRADRKSGEFNTATVDEQGHGRQALRLFWPRTPMSVVFFDEAWAFVEDRRHNLLLCDGFSIVVEARHLPPQAIGAQKFANHQ